MKGIPERYSNSISSRAIYPTSKSATFLIIIQKPFSSGKKISQDQWIRVIRHAVIGSCLSLLWLFGLSLCGPLRTILIFEHSEVVVIAGASALFSGIGGPSKLRGAVFFLVAIIALLLFDHDNPHLMTSEHPEGKHHHGISHLFYYLISWAGVADHKGGVLLLAVTLCLYSGFNNAARKLSVDLGGAKRLNSLSTLVSAIILAPWALFLRITQESSVDSWLSLFLPFCITAIVVFIIDYYVQAICAQKLESIQAIRCATFAVFGAGLVLTFIWNHPYTTSITTLNKVKEIIAEEHVLSGGVIFSCIMLLFATLLLSAPSKSGSKGSFVGYSSTGLPLYNFTGDALQRTSHSVLLIIRNGLKQILDESDSRKIFYFLCLNLAFTFVELIYGIWTNSLGLISDGFHMLFDCSALVMGLYAALMSRWKATRIFSFGYGRVEILSGFMNGLFLVVISFFVFMEALSRLFDPPEIITERLLTVSVAGLCVNLIGISVFHHGHSSSGSSHNHGHGHSHGSGIQHQHQHIHSHSHSNANMQGVFLHIIADTLGSVGVIVSSLLIENFGFLVADPICSIFIAILIFLSVLPLLKESSLMLLLRTPVNIEKDINNALQKVLAIEGVLSYRDQHFWHHSADILAGTIHVQVQPDTSEQKIISQVSVIFRDLGFTHFTVQVEKEEYFHHLSGLSSQTQTAFQATKFMATLNFNTSTLVKAV